MIGPGERVGRFVLGKRLGAGGMGAVFEARDPELSRTVAIKVLHDRRGDPVRLLREAQALARISHPNVVTVYELGTHDDQVFVAMELIDGVTIDQHLAAGTRTWREVLALYVQAGRGLAAVHAGGLVHRDVKPSNLLVDRKGRVRVGDFGLARHDGGDATPAPPAERAEAPPSQATTVDGRTSGDTVTATASDTGDLPRETPVVVPESGLLAAPLTATGAVLGTPRYMAPEQRAGERVTHHADQFGFCVALWEGLYGEHPFDGTARRPARRGAGVPAWVERALARGLARAPAERWPSTEALVDVLERTPRRRRAFALGAGAVALAGAVGVAFVVAAGGSSRVDCARTGVAADAARAAVRGAAAADARAGDALDRWIARWTAVRIDACRATHDRGEQSAAVLDRRVACLDGELTVFTTLAEALGRADAAAARLALDAVDHLPAPESCTAARVADVALPSRDPRAAEVERAIAAARVAVELRSADVRVAADRALAAARDLGEPGPRARALLVHAEAIVGTDADAARAELDEAQADAAAARDPGIEAAVLLRALRLAADHELVERIDALVPVARAAVTRAGDPRPLRLDLALAELGAYVHLGRLDDSRSACDRAVGLADPADAARVKATCTCAVALVGRDNPTAVTACADVVAIARSHYGDVHPRVADATHNQIIALIRSERLDDAAAATRAYLALAQQLWGERSREMADALQVAAVVDDHRGDSAASRATLERALAIIDEVGGPDDPARSGLLMELADRAAALGDQAAATRFADLGLAVSERVLGSDSPDLAVAVAFHARAIGADPAQYDRAVASWQRAIAIAERTRGPQSYEVASFVSSYGFFLWTHRHDAEALPFFQRALPIFDAVPEPLAAARAQGSIGEILLNLHRPAEARAALLDARARFTALGEPVADELAEIERLLAQKR